MATKTQYLLGLLSMTVLLLSSCSTGSKVPSVNPSDLPAISFKALSPRSLQIVTKDTRSVNQTAGNSVEVEKSISDVLSSAAIKGGLEIDSKSENKFLVLISDYQGDDGKMGRCVKITGSLTAKWGSTIAAEAFACHQIKHHGGNLSKAYTLALKTVLQSLESQQMVLLGRTM